MRAVLCLALVAGGLVAEDHDKKQLHEDHAPTPYSAAEIRAACSHGRVTTFRVKRSGAVIRQTMRFSNPDGDGVSVQIQTQGPDGKVLTRPANRSAWKALQAHASFQKAQTTIEDATMSVPFGRFACSLYTVTNGDTVTRLYFAGQLPGPPVQLTQTKAGNELMSMTMVEHRSFDYEKVFGRQSLDGAAVAKVSVDVAARVLESPAKVGSPQLVEAVVKTDLSFRHVALRVKSGALAGAILRVRDGKEVGRTLRRTFDLPAGFTLPPGELEGDIVDLR